MQYLSNLSTQFRPAQTKNTGFFPLPASRADRARADDSEQISPPPITHHPVYENTRNLQRNHVSQLGKYSYRVGPLVDTPSSPKGRSKSFGEDNV